MANPSRSAAVILTNDPAAVIVIPSWRSKVLVAFGFGVDVADLDAGDKRGRGSGG